MSNTELNDFVWVFVLILNDEEQKNHFLLNERRNAKSHHGKREFEIFMVIINLMKRPVGARFPDLDLASHGSYIVVGSQGVLASWQRFFSRFSSFFRPQKPTFQITFRSGNSLGPH